MKISVRSVAICGSQSQRGSLCFGATEVPRHSGAFCEKAAINRQSIEQCSRDQQCAVLIGLISNAHNFPRLKGLRPFIVFHALSGIPHRISDADRQSEVSLHVRQQVIIVL